MSVALSSFTGVRLQRFAFMLTMFGMVALFLAIRVPPSYAQHPVPINLVPPSCEPFLQKYLSSAPQDGSIAPFSLTTNAGNQVVSYVGASDMTVFKASRTLGVRPRNITG